jgi:hypothetical protein
MVSLPHLEEAKNGASVLILGAIFVKRLQKTKKKHSPQK